MKLAALKWLALGTAAVGVAAVAATGDEVEDELEGEGLGPQVRFEKPTTTEWPTDPRVIEAQPAVGTGEGSIWSPYQWATLTNWKDEEQRERRVGDAFHPGVVYVTVRASVPVVSEWVKIGKTKYHYCDGPGNVKAIVKAILNVTTIALDKGVASAAPQWSAVAKIVGNIIKKIPKLVERARQKKWAKWRQNLLATEDIGSSDWMIARHSMEICRTWKYEGFWDGEALELSLVKSTTYPGPIEIPWKDGTRDLTGCLEGEPPRVTVSADGQIRVTLFRPDEGPPGACESRYDVTAVIE